ncbi:MAG: hypothetical protein ACRDHO_08485, partial [Actinomycetota bacterium]
NSPLAHRLIDQAGQDLAHLVDSVARRGALTEAVVAGGGTIVHQQSLAAAFVTAVRQRRPDIEVVILTDPPVAGAIELARRAAHRGHRRA